jgi:hypothetical protein
MSTRRPWKFRTASMTAILDQPDAMRLDVPFVVLDNPCFGNAVYLLRGDWKVLSSFSKSELLREHADSVERIFHSQSWFDLLRQRLEDVGHKPIL